jgi:hypothetical protein
VARRRKQELSWQMPREVDFAVVESPRRLSAKFQPLYGKI